MSDKDLGAQGATAVGNAEPVASNQLSHAGSGNTTKAADLIREAIHEAYQTWFLWKGDLQIGAWTHADGIRFQQMLLSTERALIAKYETADQRLSEASGSVPSAAQKGSDK